MWEYALFHVYFTALFHVYFTVSKQSIQLYQEMPLTNDLAVQQYIVL